MNGKLIKHVRIPVLIVSNIVLIALMVAVFVYFNNQSKLRLEEQNLNDIININHSAANISSEFFDSQKNRLQDRLRYQKKNNLNKDDFLNFLYETNGDQDTNYQLVGADCRGTCVNVDGHKKSNFGNVDYSHSDYSAMKDIFEAVDPDETKIFFTPEFTNNCNGLRSFAFYSYIQLEDVDGIVKPYTLMVMSNSDNFAGRINKDGGFEDLNTVLINSKGDYVISDSNFQSGNVFRYIYIYNDLSRDEMNALSEKINKDQGGTLYYKNGSGKDCVFVFAKIAGTLWYTVSCVPISSFHTINYDVTLTIILIVILLILMILDIVWLIELNKRLKRAALEAQYANEAKTDFLSNMSHDIRTPINVIVGMTDLALKEKPSEEVKDYLDNIQSSGKFLLGLVNDILDINKVESGKTEIRTEPYTFEEFKRYINAIILPLCSAKNIEFKVTINDTSKTLVVDKLHVNQIFFNLLSNSVKFTPSGGHINLDMNLKEITPGKIRLVSKVIDDGIGMSKDFQRNMFDAFAQENLASGGDNQGTGLGLAIVEKLVELMGGSIAVVSDEGKGTTFTITLDTDVAEGFIEMPEKEYDDKIIAGKRILLCEDHPLNAIIVEKLLEAKGAIVDTAENGKIGLDMIEESSEGYYDMVLMDIRMPVMDGLTATRKIRALSGRQDTLSIPIIALTANAYDGDIDSCLNAGANAHLAKPIDNMQFYALLAKFLSMKEEEKQ